MPSATYFGLPSNIGTLQLISSSSVLSAGMRIPTVNIYRIRPSVKKKNNPDEARLLIGFKPCISFFCILRIHAVEHPTLNITRTNCS